MANSFSGSGLVHGFRGSAVGQIMSIGFRSAWIARSIAWHS